MALSSVGHAPAARDPTADCSGPSHIRGVRFRLRSKKLDTAHSDVDLLVVSDSLAYAGVFLALEAASDRLDRKLNRTLCTRADLRSESRSETHLPRACLHKTNYG